MEDISDVKVLTRNIINLKRFSESGSKEWSCTNPSIGMTPKGDLLVAYRASNYVILPTGELHVTNGGRIMNRVYVSELNKSDYSVVNFRRLGIPKFHFPIVRGLEDPKLFWRDGKWKMSVVMLEKEVPVARLAICTLDSKVSKIVDIELLNGVSASKPEKNWMLPDFKDNVNFDFIYGPSSIVKNNKVISEMNNSSALPGLRGNSNLLSFKDGTYLAVMHKLWVKRYTKYSPRTFSNQEYVIKDYTHYFVLFDNLGGIIQISDAFRFLGPGIEYASGLVKVGDSIIISFGREDVSSHLAIVPFAFVMSSLKNAN